MTERLTRAKVVMHAATLVDEIGFDELTITKLGRSLGITPPGIYRHVTGLSDLQREISRLAAEEAGKILSSACTGLSGTAALTALATTMREWATKHPGRYVALQVAPAPGDESGQTAIEPILTATSSALRAYELEGDDLTDAIRFVRSTLHGYISLELNGGFKQPRSIDATFLKITASMNTALRGWAS